MDFRQRLFQYRSYTPIPFLLVMIIVAHPTPLSLVTGLFIVAFGEFLRLWGVAIAGSETRTTGPVGGTFLITKGPFSFVRNPLYVGNILMYFGVGVMSNTPVLALVALFYFLFQYSMIVSLEEEYLLKAFGNEYVKYCQSVPRFIPVFKRYNDGIHPQPELDWTRGLISEKRTLQAIGLLTIALLILWRLRG
ncbi:MAG: isoprenylcysteine carboxylmethyltransferase family protein [Ignavibacteria bacterium]|nr:isoprenylcysteine carboxylmethyltransferase family protein [Ignavibacteria bacterium]MBI3766733.1 isoprenylcysteine carboxylmethyltransferase family protein [Ignavibacteriales bacterium]